MLQSLLPQIDFRFNRNLFRAYGLSPKFIFWFIASTEVFVVSRCKRTIPINTDLDGHNFAANPNTFFVLVLLGDATFYRMKLSRERIKFVFACHPKKQSEFLI